MAALAVMAEPGGLGQVSLSAAVPSDSGSSASGPVAILQQFGKLFSGTCNSVATASINWAGVAGGGWNESWAWWVNGGLGGPVCTRNRVFSTTQSKWIVE